MSTTIAAPPLQTPAPRSPQAGRIPPLQPGDRLTRDEFERRYSAMPHLKKAELIDGRVYMFPVSDDYHGNAHFDLIDWLGDYRKATPGLRGSDNATVRLDLDNEPQPDVCLRILPSHGGQSRNEDTYIAGPPELVAEVAASSVSYDLHEKLNVYRRNGVKEYIVWRTQDREIDWFILRGGAYQRLMPGEDGIYRSEMFPGLWLDAEALLAGQCQRVGEVVQMGIASEEHKAFVARLKAAGEARS